MKRLLILIALVPAPALAQQAFVPFVVTEKDAQQLRSYLDEQPMKFSLPVLRFLDSLEQRAVAQAQEKPKEEEKK